MRRKIPSTAALVVFETAARYQSFTKAAGELSITQSAVCRQINGLEAFLGAKLFRRDRRGVVLTEAGADYSRKVAARLDEVERDTLDMMAKGAEGGTLSLAVVPTFATRWLLPRMPKFVEKHPEITVNLTTQTRPFLFDDTNYDAAIHTGAAVWPGTEGLALMQESFIAVCSPKLKGPRSKFSPEDWNRYPLLQHSTRPYGWRDWFSSCGLAVEGDMTGPRYELFSMLANAAIHGMGIALIPRLLIHDELRQGALIQIGHHEHISDRSYYLIYPERNADKPVLAVYRDWLEQQARDYSEEIKVA